MKRDRTPTIHQLIVSNIINANGKNHIIEPNKFRKLLGSILHIKREYSIIVIKELHDVGLISEYSGKEIVFDRKKIDNILLE